MSIGIDASMQRVDRCRSEVSVARRKPPHACIGLDTVSLDTSPRLEGFSQVRPGNSGITRRSPCSDHACSAIRTSIRRPATPSGVFSWISV